MIEKLLTEIGAIGRDHAIHQYELSVISGIPSRRLRQMIHDERMEGSLICSGASGYYIPTSEEDIERFCRFMCAEAHSRFKITNTMKKSMKERG